MAETKPGLTPGSIYGFGESFKSRSPPLQGTFSGRERRMKKKKNVVLIVNNLPLDRLEKLLDYIAKWRSES